MKQYDNYKDSGIEWIGEIPEHWEVKPLKHLVQCNSEALTEKTNPEMEINYIEIGDVSAVDGIKETTIYTFENAPSRARRIVRDGDVIISTVRTYLKAITSISSNFDGYIASTGFAVLTPKLIHPSFLGNIALSEGLVGEIISLSKGVSYPSITAQDLTNISIPFPNNEEQTQIANYLDHKTSQINSLISKKQQFITLLQEERIATINQAVTKGLDTKVKMKDSSIEWLGEIPEHWGEKKLKYVGNCQNGISEGADYFGSGYPFVSYSDVYKNNVLPTSVAGLAQSTQKHQEHYSVQESDVFFTRTSETIEEIGIASICYNTIEKAVFAGFLIKFRPNKELIIKEFSKYYFRCFIPRTFFIKEMNLVTRASLSQELLKRLPILLPSIDEQKEIAFYLDKKTNEIDNIITKTQQEIELLKEYKTALISEVVTGKIDVRELVLN